MSKALNPLSIAVGKLGNAVYYKLKYSSTGQKQGIREYVPQPSNPQTDSQIDQRMKMTAITSCYRAFGDVIRRAFEGTEYGQPSYARWSSLALAANFAGPYLPKGSRTPCPVLGTPMSIGSLPQVTVTSAGETTLKTNLICIGEIGTTFGQLSQILLNDNQYLQEGDQVTICLCAIDSFPVGNVLGGSYSFYLNPNDSTVRTNILGCNLFTENSLLSIESSTYCPLCACVILSREGSHLRSTSYWGITDGFDQVFIMTPDNTMRNTYRTKYATKSSDWPVDPDATPAQGTVTAVTASGLSVELYGLRVDGNYLVASGRNAATQESLGEFYFHDEDTISVHYNKWLTGFSSVGSEAPTESAADTIPFFTVSNMTTAQKALFRWLVANGVNEYWLLTGNTV